MQGKICTLKLIQLVEKTALKHFFYNIETALVDKSVTS